MANSAPEILWYFGNRIQIAKAQQLKKLDLSVPWNTHQNDKLHRIPQEIFELTHLESLDLSGNEITEIPTAINQLTNLTTLDAVSRMYYHSQSVRTVRSMAQAQKTHSLCS
ncbi:MAG: leucine-rich repeat domain-containing protein, partial [Cyanobacteria bacterium P01_G01_bin.67]